LLLGGGLISISGPGEKTGIIRNRGGRKKRKAWGGGQTKTINPKKTKKNVKGGRFRLPKEGTSAARNLVATNEEKVEGGKGKGGPIASSTKEKST